MVLRRLVRPSWTVWIRALRSPSGGALAEETVAVANAETRLLGTLVEHAFAPLRVEIKSEPVAFAMVTARDQMMVVGLDEAP